MSSSTTNIKNVRVTALEFAADVLTAELSDGRILSVPLSWYPRLAHATPEERQNWRPIGGGHGMHWPLLDEDISVENLLLGKPSAESQASLKRWLESRRPSK